MIQKNHYIYPNTENNKETETTKMMPMIKKGIFWEARTRILLCYIGLILGFMSISIPILYKLILHEVHTRVREDLSEEIGKFDRFIAPKPSPVNLTELDSQFDQFLDDAIPEDDTFLITIVDNKFHDSSPRALPSLLEPGSILMQKWKKIDEENQGEENSFESEIGTVLYRAKPIFIEGEIQGVFVAAHITSGEEQEALASFHVTLQVLSGGMILAIIFSWIISGVILTPLKTLTKTVRDVSQSDLNERIPVEGKGEIAELAITFNEMMTRLQNSFETQRNFLNDVGHELRTPITIIQGHLELMGDDPEEQHETLALVFDELERINRLVNDLILLARTQRPDFLQPEILDVRALTEEFFLKAKGITARDWQLVNRGKGKILVDRQRLTQAMMNLIQNAIQHTNSSQTITIGSNQVGNKIRFWVQDQGKGISIEDRERIFQRFVRLNHQKRSEGLGLGLAIVQAIASAHGGSVELISEIGSGSTFILVLPLETIEKRRF